MNCKTDNNSTHQNITIEDVNRLLEVGRILKTVLTEEEIKRYNQYGVVFEKQLSKRTIGKNAG